jgi:hypothetical protein
MSILVQNNTGNVQHAFNGSQSNIGIIKVPNHINGLQGMKIQANHGVIGVTAQPPQIINNKHFSISSQNGLLPKI